MMFSRAMIVGLFVFAFVLVLGLASSCSFGVDDTYLDTHDFKCSGDEDCAEGFECKTIEDGKELKLCRAPDVGGEDNGNACKDEDLDTWWTGPVICRQCPPGQPDCPEDPNDENDQIYPGATEKCDGEDNDGDGKVDQDDEDYLATKCPLQIGACDGAERPCGGKAGPLSCDDDNGAVYKQHNDDYSSDEICGDGIDNNCDTEIDPARDCECLNGETEECRSEAFGECALVVGLRTCVDSRWGDACEGAVEPTPEVCDGLDNDCDGRVDEHPDNPDESVCEECPWNMVFLQLGEERWCVDRWEGSKDPDTPARPASVPDAQPWVNISFNEVTNACALASAGRARAKEVCPITVWTQACKTQANTVYPYGNDFQPQNCNGNAAGPDLTGSKASCISAWPDRQGSAGSGQIFDMSGNVAEWVRPPPNNQTLKRVHGGSFDSGGDPLELTCEDEEDRSGDTSGQAYIGFRCCEQLD